MNRPSTNPRTIQPSAVMNGRQRQFLTGSVVGLFVALTTTASITACDRKAQEHAQQEHAQQAQAPQAHDEPARGEHDHEGYAHGTHDHGETPPPPSGVNPVQHEMRLLQEAMVEAVTAIGSGDVRGVAKKLHVVHGAKEQTEAALRAKTYQPPKNGDAVPRFIELDEEFHTLLEHLVAKSKANDVVGTASALGKVLEGCQGCHTEFRF